MKKLIVLFAAFFAVMTAASAFAADNLDLSGTFRFRGWDMTNAGFVNNADSSYFDQRMRLYAKIKANDNAYAVIRADLGDGQWGNTFSYGIARPGAQAGGSFRQAIDFDRLYAVLDKDMFTLTIGQQYFGLGIAEVMDAEPTAIKLRLKLGMVEPTLLYGKLSENGSLNDDNAFDDTNLYAVNLSMGAGGFDMNAFFAAIDNNATDDNPWAIGFHAAGPVGPVSLVGEISTFGGDNGLTGAAARDYVGTQFYLKASADVTDMVNVGAELLYAVGTDDPTETQNTNLIDWWTFTPMSNNTPGDAEFSSLASDPFDLASKDGVAGTDGAGSQGITLFAEIKPMADLSLGGKVGYFTPEEDNSTTLDSITAFNAWIAYKLGPNTTASLTYLLTSPDYDVATVNDENEGTLYAQYVMKF